MDEGMGCREREIRCSGKGWGWRKGAVNQSDGIQGRHGVQGRQTRSTGVGEVGEEVLGGEIMGSRG